MDVRFYPQPPPPSATDPSRLGQSHYSDSPYCNKYDSENMFMSMPEPSQDFVPGNQFRVPASPSQTHHSNKQAGGHWKRDNPTHTDGPRLTWSYPVPSLGDEDYNIPPITPPTLPEHMLAHLPESESGTYHHLCPPVSQNGLHHFHLQGMDLPGMSVPNMLGQDGGLLTNSLSVKWAHEGEMTTAVREIMMQQMVNSDSRYGGHPQVDTLRPRVQPGMVPQGHLTTINQSQLNTQLGLNNNNGTHGSPSPPESKSATPSPSSSVHEDDADDAAKVNGAEKRAATDMAKKPKTPKKKKKKDPNEPQKPVSAYALFFRDTQAAIKGQNPNATFGEVSKIVASMWDGLGEEQKQMYKKKTETAKKEYLKQLAAYRASLVSQSYNDLGDVKASQASHMLGPKPPVFSGAGQSHPGLYMAPPYHQQPGLSPHLPPMQPGLARGGASRPNAPMPGAVSMGSMTGSSPPPLQISPPLHQHLNLHQQQQQLSSHPLPMHSPSMAQGFPLQTEYQSMVNVTSSAGPGLSPSMDYRTGCRNGPTQGLDWTPDYCGNGNLQRDKALYLT
ncbi:thymocyte selection-associated high mobility group box protein TOX-like isoform X2 [Sinocyclocheilus rhinocerous]|uniref:thymocyte selection-associated high mobility group box protein TOX-like isoform X2 n=1 Tax=Sinocyclocheilus rhinocerous TaxID=307959 RepID=UPI0007BA8B88|nr:PREDICTED: thymocyte selection-associated high mobility group box protein TOX-like isoform X2 [Sinocyclocheilus rhinocerous]